MHAWRPTSDPIERHALFMRAWMMLGMVTGALAALLAGRERHADRPPR
jgi:hypothetical protein